MKVFWKSHRYYAVLYFMFERSTERFNDDSLILADAVDGLFYLNFEQSKCFLEHYGDVLKLKVEPTFLEAKMTVAKSLLKSEAEIKVRSITRSTESGELS